MIIKVNEKWTFWEKFWVAASGFILMTTAASLSVAIQSESPAVIGIQAALLLLWTFNLCMFSSLPERRINFEKEMAEINAEIEFWNQQIAAANAANQDVWAKSPPSAPSDQSTPTVH